MTKPLRTINFGGEDTYHLAPEWNNVDGRPFGEETVYGDTLTWDGNTSGLNVDGFFCHISDATLQSAPPAGEYSIGMSNGAVITGPTDGVPVEWVQENTEQGAFVMFGEFIWCVPCDNFIFEESLVFPKKGIYFGHTEDFYATSLTINGYNGFETTTVKPIDNKYLEPFETVGGDTLTWDGDTSGKDAFDGALFKVSDATPTLDEVSSYSITTNNGTIFDSDGIPAQVIPDVFNAIALGGEFVLIIPNDVSEDGLELEKGTYFVCVDGFYITSLTINGYTGFTTTKLKEEYLPEQSGGGGSMVVTITETDTQTYISDKTFAEIEKAINDGKNVTVRTILPNGACMYYKLVIHQSGQVVGFDLVQYVAYTKELQILMFVISADNSVTMQITALKMEE